MEFEYDDRSRDLMKLKPSEVWRGQCPATFQFERIGAKLVEDLGVETLCGAPIIRTPTGCGRTPRNTSPSGSPDCLLKLCTRSLARTPANSTADQLTVAAPHPLRTERITKGG